MSEFFHPSDDWIVVVQVKLKDYLVSGLDFSKARDAELAWIDGVINEKDAEDNVDKEIYDEEEDEDIKMKSTSSTVTIYCKIPFFLDVFIFKLIHEIATSQIQNFAKMIVNGIIWTGLNWTHQNKIWQRKIAK